MNKGMLIVISGPSGVGKGTVLSKVFENDGNLAYSVSCTTRKPRAGEKDGVHYRFLTEKEFLENIAQNRMLEYTVYCDNYYGTDAQYVEKLRESGIDVVLEIETNGALNIIEKCPDAVTVFIAPPSLEHLYLRLAGRGTESRDVIEKRIAKAKEELTRIDYYEYLVINDSVEKAAEDILAVLRAERIKKYNKNNFRGVLL